MDLGALGAFTGWLQYRQQNSEWYGDHRCVECPQTIHWNRRKKEWQHPEGQRWMVDRRLADGSDDPHPAFPDRRGEPAYEELKRIADRQESGLR